MLSTDGAPHPLGQGVRNQAALTLCFNSALTLAAFQVAAVDPHLQLGKLRQRERPLSLLSPALDLPAAVLLLLLPQQETAS